MESTWHQIQYTVGEAIFKSFFLLSEVSDTLNELSMKLELESRNEIRPQITLNTMLNFTILGVGKGFCLRMNGHAIFSPLRS